MPDPKLDGNVVALERHLDEMERPACAWCDDAECTCDPDYEQSRDDALAEDAHDARGEE